VWRENPAGCGSAVGGGCWRSVAGVVLCGFLPREAGRGGMMRVVRPSADVVSPWRARPRAL